MRIEDLRIGNYVDVVLKENNTYNQEKVALVRYPYSMWIQSSEVFSS